MEKPQLSGSWGLLLGGSCGQSQAGGCQIHEGSVRLIRRHREARLLYSTGLLIHGTCDAAVLTIPFLQIRGWGARVCVPFRAGILCAGQWNMVPEGRALCSVPWRAELGTRWAPGTRLLAEGLSGESGRGGVAGACQGVSPPRHPLPPAERCHPSWPWEPTSSATRFLAWPRGSVPSARAGPMPSS